jgi:hypothetical protein
MKFVTIGAANALSAIKKGILNAGAELHDIPREFGNPELISLLDLHHINTCDAVILFGTWGSKHKDRVWRPEGAQRQAWLETMNMFIVNYCKSINKKLIVLETATLARARTIYDTNKNFKGLRPRYYRMGLNHWTYGHGTFCKGNEYDRLHDLVKTYSDMRNQLFNHTWKNNKDGFILILPGLENDPTSSMPVDEFVKKAVEDIKKVTDRKICIKPHPLSSIDFTNLGVEILDKQPIENLLKDVYCGINDNSTSIFELITLGIPCVTSNHSFGTPLQNTNISNIENLYYATKNEILEWYRMLSYTQFTLEEFAKPDIVKYIKELING